MDFNLLLFVILIFGLIVGSFLNSIIYRLNNNKSFLRGRSFCPACEHKLNWIDLIPIFSFLILKGRCRYCKKPIVLQYPIVEFITGFLFAIIFWQTQPIQNFQSVIYFIYLSTVSCFLIVIFVSDLKYYVIPDKIIYPAIAIAFLYRLFEFLNFACPAGNLFSCGGHWDLFRISDLGFGILPSVIFLAIILFSRGKWMGLGDFKLAVLMGLFLGWPNILIALFLAVILGAIMGLGLIILKKKTLKSTIPFGPFLVIGTFIALFWGSNIVQWYFNIFL